MPYLTYDTQVIEYNKLFNAFNIIDDKAMKLYNTVKDLTDKYNITTKQLAATIIEKENAQKQLYQARVKKEQIHKELNIPDSYISQGGSPKIHILGRYRTVTVKGRSRFITYQGKLLNVTNARILEKAMNK